MKQLLSTIVLIAISISSFAQLGIGTTNPDTSAVLDLTSTTKGFLPPRMTKMKMEAITKPKEGLMVYCTDCNPNGLYINVGGPDSTNKNFRRVGGFKDLMQKAVEFEDFIKKEEIFNSNLLKSISIISSGGGITDFQLEGTTRHNFVYKPINIAVSDGSTQTQTWLNNDLGANYANLDSRKFNPAQQATSYTDVNAYGQYYQWGRKNAVGDQKDSFGSWNTSPASDDSWETANDPCPEGYRVPTSNELGKLSVENIRKLKLSKAGFRSSQNGKFQTALVGFYWSSSFKEKNNGGDSNNKNGVSCSLIKSGNFLFILKSSESSNTSGYNVRCIAK